MKKCLFCNYDNDSYIVENEFGFAVYDKFPVNEGHALIIPKRHYKNFFDSTEDEIIGLYDLLNKAKEIIDNKYKPTGYNVGVNIGEDGGQTIMHLHIHLIPRYKGDIDNPRGGIRKLKKELVPYNG